MAHPGGPHFPENTRSTAVEPQAPTDEFHEATVGRPEWTDDLEFGIEPETISLLLAVPELATSYLILAEAADGDPGTAAAFEALADHVADLLCRADDNCAQLQRCMAAVEGVAAHSPDAEDLVAWGFLDNLAPSERGLLRPWFGPRTAAFADALDLPDTVPWPDAPESGHTMHPPATGRY